LTDLPRTQLPDAERTKLGLRPGDLLFMRTNSHELVGQTGLVEGHTDAVFASYLVRLRVDPAETSRPALLELLDEQSCWPASG